MPAREKAHPKGAINARIGEDLAARIDESARVSGRTRTGEFVKLVEAGLDMQAMSRGPSSALLIDLFVAVRSNGEALTILKAMQKHFPPGALAAAVAAAGIV